MRRKSAVALALAAVSCSQVAVAQVSDLEAGKAQGEMIQRVNRSVRNFLATYKLNEMYASYCRTQMNLDTKDSPSGLIPFGVNYHTIPDKKTLDLIIYNREAYETAYLKLCLSRALKTLDAVNAFEKFDGLEK